MTGVAWTATQIAGLLATDDVIHIADDDQQAEAVAAALRALCPDRAVFCLPACDALPGNGASASPGNTGARLAALRGAQRMRGKARLACVLSGEAAARRYPPPALLAEPVLRLETGAAIEPGELAERLEAIGYVADERVSQPGELAMRGGVCDIFAADAARPARIDIADGRITAIRSYDPATQLSVGALLEFIEIEHARDLPIAEATAILSHFEPATIVLSAKAEERRQRYCELARDVAQANAVAVDAIDDELWAASLASWRVVSLPSPALAIPRFAEARSPLAALARFARPLLDEGRALVLAGSERDLRFLRSRVAKRLACEFAELGDGEVPGKLQPGAARTIAMNVDAGFVDGTLVLIAAADLLGSRALTGLQTGTVANPWAVGEIHLGDVIVHEDHGVGIAVGLEPSPLAEEGEMIALEYAGGARRLIAPVDAGRIWRYGADADAVTLDKLDGSTWQKRRMAVDVAIAESARGLTALAEARRELVAPVIDPDPAAYERFARGFPFSETADQARAIGAVRDDLARGTPMDRLVVGDVGYGKTEVALRAAALAALAGYQVVVAAPTTVLVRQHLESFQSRFKASGLEVAGLSRLSSAAEKKAVKAGLADGSIAVVIGTGAVMAKDVSYSRLGLVVIDEEQRFGAADKARLRGSGEVHLLSMSATPIPRTLQMALVGLQQISVIATPPARRQPIRTTLEATDDSRMRGALLREKGRGGQSFVVVPRIEDIARLAATLRRIVPDLVVVEAHGKMAPADIDGTMVGFARGQGDVLLATNIIEAGLDVPRANTMIVWRADRFGLAQLHQLRGRVGRGNRRGEVVLLTDGADAIGARTMKRLRALTAFDQLGAGFDISAQDLDMRGAGDLLGETQAGHMKLIGVDLYQHLLGLALRGARGEDVDMWVPEINLGDAGGLPTSWIPEADLRLSLYVRLARVEDEAGLDAFEDELVDRFGPIPDPAVRLLVQARLRLASRAARVARVDAGPAAIALTPHPEFAGDGAGQGLVRKKDRLLLVEATSDEERPTRVQLLLDALTPAAG